MRSWSGRQSPHVDTMENGSALAPDPRHQEKERT
jgi:hypothetical protein